MPWVRLRRATKRQVARKRYINRAAIQNFRRRIYEYIDATPRGWPAAIRRMWYDDLVLNARQLETLTVFLHYNGVPTGSVYRYFDMAYGLSYHDKKHVVSVLNAMQVRFLGRRVYDVDERAYVNC